MKSLIINDVFKQNKIKNCPSKSSWKPLLWLIIKSPKICVTLRIRNQNKFDMNIIQNANSLNIIIIYILVIELLEIF